MAYFLEWPLPFERAKVEGTFEKELGVKVNWRSFETGGHVGGGFGRCAIPHQPRPAALHDGQPRRGRFSRRSTFR